MNSLLKAALAILAPMVVAACADGSTAPEADPLVGSWGGERFALELRADGTHALTHTVARAGVTVGSATVSGTWAADSATLTLTHDLDRAAFRASREYADSAGRVVGNAELKQLERELALQAASAFGSQTAMPLLAATPEALTLLLGADTLRLVRNNKL